MDPLSSATLPYWVSRLLVSWSRTMLAMVSISRSARSWSSEAWVERSVRGKMASLGVGGHHGSASEIGKREGALTQRRGSRGGLASGAAPAEAGRRRSIAVVRQPIGNYWLQR